MSHDTVVGLILYLLVAGFIVLPVLIPEDRHAEEPVTAPVVRSRSIRRAASARNSPSPLMRPVGRSHREGATPTASPDEGRRHGHG